MSTYYPRLHLLRPAPSSSPPGNLCIRLVPPGQGEVCGPSMEATVRGQVGAASQCLRSPHQECRALRRGLGTLLLPRNTVGSPATRQTIPIAPQG
jgi:hypothetical protein